MERTNIRRLWAGVGEDVNASTPSKIYRFPEKAMPPRHISAHQVLLRATQDLFYLPFLKVSRTPPAT